MAPPSLRAPTPGLALVRVQESSGAPAVTQRHASRRGSCSLGRRPLLQLTTMFALSEALGPPGPRWAGGSSGPCLGIGTVVIRCVLTAEISAVGLVCTRTSHLPELSIWFYYLVSLASRDPPGVCPMNLQMCHHTHLLTLDSLC